MWCSNIINLIVYNIILKNNLIICFYKNYNGPTRLIEIKKEVPIEFCRFLGYYQAEGGKEKKIKKSEGREISFTNTKLSLIKDFINLSGNLIDKSLWKIEIKLSKRNNEKENNLKKTLIRLGIIENNIKIRVEKNIKDYSLRGYICSTILSDIILTFMERIKSYLIKKENFDNNDFTMCISFIQGLFAGDGNYNAYKNKEGGIHHRMTFYDEDKRYASEYQKLLKKISIGSKIIKVNNKNLYIIRTTLNWEYLLLIRELGLFEYHNNHRISLINSINNHNSYKSHKYLSQINKNFNINQLINIGIKDKMTGYNWIKKMVDRGIIIKNDINNWTLSNEGQRIKNILIKP